MLYVVAREQRPDDPDESEAEESDRAGVWRAAKPGGRTGVDGQSPFRHYGKVSAGYDTGGPLVDAAVATCKPIQVDDAQRDERDVRLFAASGQDGFQTEALGAGRSEHDGRQPGAGVQLLRAKDSVVGADLRVS